MKNLSPELLKKYTEIILEVQAKGYPINEENLRKVAKEMGNEAILEKIEEELRIKTDKKDLKKTPKIYNEEEAKREATNITIKIFVGVGALIAIIFACISYFSAIVSIPKRHSVIFYDAFTSAQGSIIWLIYARYDNSPIINLVDGQNKKLLKEITTDITSPETHVINNAIYLFDKKSRFEARDSYTGEIILNNELLSKQLPRLASGIGTAKYNSGWLDIVTKQGEVFYYHLQTNKLYNEIERENLLEKYQKEKFIKFSWGIIESNTEVKTLMLTSKNANFYNENEYTQKNTHRIIQSNWDKLKRNEQMYDNEKLIFSPEKTFLSAEIIYADSVCCVVRHQTEIGDNAKPIYSCVGAKEKKILWEIQNIDPKQSMLLTNLDKGQVSSLLCTRYQNLLNISTQYCQVEGKKKKYSRLYPISCQIDVQTGKILWECTPTF